MDVEGGRIYPVFDVLKNSGGKDGKFTYPRDDPDAYPPGVHKNRWTADQDGVLLSTAGHVHTGGLYTDLSLSRPGAKYAGPEVQHQEAGQPLGAPAGRRRLGSRATTSTSSAPTPSTSSRQARSPGTSR